MTDVQYFAILAIVVLAPLMPPNLARLAGAIFLIIGTAIHYGAFK